MARLKQTFALPPTLTRTEQRAAEIDIWVKGHIAEVREAEKAKTSRLRALREAREAELPQPGNEPRQGAAPRTVKRLRRICVPGPDFIVR